MIAFPPQDPAATKGASRPPRQRRRKVSPPPSLSRAKLASSHVQENSTNFQLKVTRFPFLEGSGSSLPASALPQ